jgi:NADPH:quinone reductase-like Zn-dependent oxidoreductase
MASVITTPFVVRSILYLLQSLISAKACNTVLYGIDATWFILHPSRDQLIRIGELIDSGRVKPVVDTILPLSQASQAYEGAKGVHKHGKIVLRVR